MKTHALKYLMIASLSVMSLSMPLSTKALGLSGPCSPSSTNNKKPESDGGRQLISCLTGDKFPKDLIRVTLKNEMAFRHGHATPQNDWFDQLPASLQETLYQVLSLRWATQSDLNKPPVLDTEVFQNLHQQLMKEIKNLNTEFKAYWTNPTDYRRQHQKQPAKQNNRESTPSPISGAPKHPIDDLRDSMQDVDGWADLTHEEQEYLLMLVLAEEEEKHIQHMRGPVSQEDAKLFERLSTRHAEDTFLAASEDISEQDIMRKRQEQDQHWKKFLSKHPTLDAIGLVLAGTHNMALLETVAVKPDKPRNHGLYWAPLKNAHKQLGYAYGFSSGKHVPQHLYGITADREARNLEPVPALRSHKSFSKHTSHPGNPQKVRVQR